jgi:lysozyme
VNLERLKNQLREDEGDLLTVYLDTEQVPTVGVGHRITYADTLELGDIITEDRKENLFENDINSAITSCRLGFVGFDLLPETIQEILVNMAFNLGWTKLARFYKMRVAVNNHDWEGMKREMIDSRWYYQVGNRSKKLVKRLEDEVLNGT